MSGLERLRAEQAAVSVNERAKACAAEMVDMLGLHAAKDAARDRRLSISEGGDERVFWTLVCASLQLDY